MEQFRQALGVLNKRTTLLCGDDSLSRAEKEFMYELTGRTAETKRTYRRHFNHLYDFIGTTVKADNPREYGMSMPIKCLDIEGIGIHYYAYLSSLRLSEQTVISCMRNFRVIYYWLAKHKLVQQQKIEVHSVEPPLKTTFTEDEIHKLTSHKPPMEDFCAYRDWVMVNYLLATGNRVGSMLSLRVKDIDFETDEIRVQHTKSKRPQVISMQPKLKAILAEYVFSWRMSSTDAALFCNVYGDDLQYTGAVNSFIKYFAARNVVWNGFHKFRHSYAANWIRCGGDSLTLKAQLGHSSLAMTNRYANLYGTAVASEAAKYSLISTVKINAGRHQLCINK